MSASSVKLVSITPNLEQVLVDCARVSNPANQGKDGKKLLKYLVKNAHWSPMEMGHMVLEIDTPRDIARQILRHRSFSFQEYSQRYAAVDTPLIRREARMQDAANRQNSLPCSDAELQALWEEMQIDINSRVRQAYDWAISNGIAKECARVILPEGLTMSKLYMSGTIRSWIHYIEIRADVATQLEHREVAEQAKAILLEQLPCLEEVLA